MTKSISKKLAEIMRLVYLINLKTPYAAFFNFSGHVNSIEVRIGHSKVNTYSTDIANSRVIYLDKDKTDRYLKLNRLITNLKKFIGKDSRVINLISKEGGEKNE